jgi:hypothetical protein
MNAALFECLQHSFCLSLLADYLKQRRPRRRLWFRLPHRCLRSHGTTQLAPQEIIIVLINVVSDQGSSCEY